MTDETLTLDFSDGSTYTLSVAQVQALHEKHSDQYATVTFPELVDYVRLAIEDQFGTHHVLTKFGVQTWEEHGRTYETMARLAEESVYGFVRFYLLRQAGREMGVRVMSPEEMMDEIRREKGEHHENP